MTTSPNRFVWLFRSSRAVLNYLTKRLQWRWLLLGSVILGVSLWLGIPPLDYDRAYEDPTRLYFGTWYAANPKWHYQTDYDFHEEANGLRFRMFLSNSTDTTATDLIDARIVVPHGSRCELVPSQLHGVDESVQEIADVVPNDYPVLSAFQIKSTDEKATVTCWVPFEPTHTSYSRRSLVIVVANPPPDTFWKSFQRGDVNVVKLDDSDSDEVRMDSSGEVDGKVVWLRGGQQLVKYEWMDRRKDKEAAIRIWLSGAALGLAASAFVEAIRKFLDGQTESYVPKKKPRYIMHSRRSSIG